jgi:hypothetical protein
MIEKTGLTNIICIKCDKQALPGSEPPLCETCSKLEKTADAGVGLRELTNDPTEVFDGFSLS